MSVVLRLFQQSDPATELERRVLARGELAVGRDKAAGWTVPDPSRTLSRRHCLFAVDGAVVTVRDDSTNGVCVVGGERLPSKIPTPVSVGQTVALGAYLIRIEASENETAPAPGPSSTVPVVVDETPAGRLLDAFCAGAQIDSSVLSAEDATEVMRRLGAVYREMVNGLGRLVGERTRAKAEFGLEWTAVQALDNNPFRWAPPQRLAVDLLQARQDGFLTSEAAVRASFEDISDHQARLTAGSQASAVALLECLAPETIADALQGQSVFMKKKTEALWAEYRRAHAQAAKELGGGIATTAFREAYVGGASEASLPD